MAEDAKKRRYRKALEELRMRVVTGALPLGERVPEVALAEEIGISRTPLREAMHALVEEGLLERRSSGGVQVRAHSPADVADAIELRGVMEGVALRRAAEEGADPAALEACRSVADTIDAALGQSADETDFDAYADRNAVLHEALAALCPSAVIREELFVVSRRPLAAPSAFLAGQSLLPQTLRSLLVAQDQHRGMIEAVASREGARAEALAREHARLALRNLRYFLTEGRAAAGLIPGLALVAGEEPERAAG